MSDNVTTLFAIFYSFFVFFQSSPGDEANRTNVYLWHHSDFYSGNILLLPVVVCHLLIIDSYCHDLLIIP